MFFYIVLSRFHHLCKRPKTAQSRPPPQKMAKTAHYHPPHPRAPPNHKKWPNRPPSATTKNGQPPTTHHHPIPPRTGPTTHGDTENGPKRHKTHRLGPRCFFFFVFLPIKSKQDGSESNGDVSEDSDGLEGNGDVSEPECNK